MVFVQCYFLLLPLLVSFLFINPASSDDQTQQLIDHICRQMEDYGFCNKAFHENMKGPSTDIAGLTQITLDLGTNNATNTYGFIVNLYQNEGDPAEKAVLLECKYAYQLVMEDFQQASKYFSQKNYGRMVEFVRLTPRVQASCDDTFSELPNPPNPLADRSRQMRILITMAIATVLDLTS